MPRSCANQLGLKSTLIHLLHSPSSIRTVLPPTSMVAAFPARFQKIETGSVRPRGPTSTLRATSRSKVNRRRTPLARSAPSSGCGTSVAKYEYVPGVSRTSGTGQPDSSSPFGTTSGGNVSGTFSTLLRTPAWPAIVQKAAPRRDSRGPLPKTPCLPGFVPVANDAQADTSADGVVSRR